MTQLVPIETNVAAYRASTDAAEMCRDIVIATATNIQGRKYVGVEGWQAVAIAHGCAAGSRDVEAVEGGVRAIGEIRRMSDGAVIATAEGFVGEDEPTWYGGEIQTRNGPKTLPKRPDYAIRAMAQTRAISRACRSAFAHVIVMMKAGLATTPAEEVPHDGFDRETGEIIDNSPAPRAKLDGPHTSKTALKGAVSDIRAKVRAAQTVEELDAIKSEHRQTINQALRDWPALIDGFPDIEEDVGLKGEIENRRAELADRTMLDELIDSMKSSATLKSLTNWMATNESLVDALDDIQRKQFDAELEAYETGLKAVETVHAG